MAELMNVRPFMQAGIDRYPDCYWSLARVLLRGGRSLGDQLVEEGLGRPYARNR